MTQLWLRAVGYCMISRAVGECDVLRPGEAVRFDPASPQHAAIADSFASGEDVPVELVEAAADPSVSPPPDDDELRERRTMDASAAHSASHARALQQWEPRHQADPSPEEADEDAFAIEGKDQ